jgi:hypothetical protein
LFFFKLVLLFLCTSFLFFNRKNLRNKSFNYSKIVEVLTSAAVPSVETSSTPGCWKFQALIIIAVTLGSLIGNRLLQKSQSLDAAENLSKLEEVTAGNLALKNVVPTAEVLQVTNRLEMVTPLPYTGLPMSSPGSSSIGLQLLKLQAKISELRELEYALLQQRFGSAANVRLIDLDADFEGKLALAPQS